jgi:hypothetical protein
MSLAGQVDLDRVDRAGAIDVLRPHLAAAVLPSAVASIWEPACAAADDGERLRLAECRDRADADDHSTAGTLVNSGDSERPGNPLASRRTVGRCGRLGARGEAERRHEREREQSAD